MKNQLPKLSEREKDVMMVLWNTRQALTASSIAVEGNGLSINTVHAVVRSLMKKNFIKVADIVYSGTVLTRNYVPIISAEQYAADQLQALRMSTLNFSTLNFIDHLVTNAHATMLSDLESAIREAKEQQGGD